MADNIERTLGRIEGKLDGMLKDREEDKQRLDNHGTRIGTLEKWQSRVLGISAAAIFIVGIALKFIK